MSLIAHLRELRNRIGKALLALVVVTAVCFWWYQHGLGTFIRAPYCNLPANLRYGGAQQACGLLVTDVFGGVFIRLKVAFLAGAVLSAPIWLYQLWAFITPGLHRNERRYALSFVAAFTTLFAGGAVLAYAFLGAGLRVLLGLAGNGVVVALTAQDYIGFVISMLIAFGVSFELPLLMVALNLVGVLGYRTLAKSRRWIFFLTIVFAAVITPTQDPFTMLAMALPMIALFEIAIQLARIVDRRRERRAAIEGFHDLPDDQASPLDRSPSPLEDEVVVERQSPAGRRGVADKESSVFGNHGKGRPRPFIVPKRGGHPLAGPPAAAAERANKIRMA